MNAFVGTLRLSSAAENLLAPELVTKLPKTPSAFDPVAFAREQISSLVRRVFFPGWPRPSKHVVFTAVESDHDIAPICQKVAETITAQVPGTVCLVDADSRSFRLESCCKPYLVSSTAQDAQTLRGRASQLSANLWLLRAADFLTSHDKEFSAAWLRHRLSELRREFDYTVIHAPAAGAFSETGLLAHLADGVVLVLNAERTRRMTAQHARDVLHAADAKLLGAVLDQRQFPIPQTLYRRL